MTDMQLSYILRGINLEDCEYKGNNIFYIQKIVTIMVYDCCSGKEKPSHSKEEFLVIAEHGNKQGIIHNCDNRDLHWYVFTRWREQSVLSDALRTGIIKRMWPNIKSVSVCYNWDDDRKTKFQKTQYLASLAGLGVTEERTCWISSR